jgi:hypothetical protein
MRNLQGRVATYTNRFHIKVHLLLPCTHAFCIDISTKRISSLYNINWLVFEKDRLCLPRGTKWLFKYTEDKFPSNAWLRWMRNKQTWKRSLLPKFSFPEEALRDLVCKRASGRRMGCLPPTSKLMWVLKSVPHWSVLQESLLHFYCTFTWNSYRSKHSKT